MEMPKPGQEHARLAKLAGHWVGEETMHPSPWAPEGGTASATIRARLGLGGFYLVSDYEQQRDGRVTFTGHGVFGFDPHNRHYTQYWFDSMGTDHGGPSTGQWQGDTLTLLGQTGESCFARYTYEVGDGEYGFKIENSTDGENWATFMDATYRRVD